MRLVRIIIVCGLMLVMGMGCSGPKIRTHSGHRSLVLRSASAHDGPHQAQMLASSGSHFAQNIVSVAYEVPTAGQSTAEKLNHVPLDSVDELSLEQLVAEVQAAHPSVEAMHAAWHAAMHRIAQVSSLEDPMFGSTFAPSSFGSRQVESAYALEALQKLPWYGKRELRGDAASAEAESASLDVETTRQKLAEVTEFAFLEFYSVRRQLDLNSQNAEILRSIRDNAVTRYQTGLVTQQDILQADVELANLEQRLIELERMESVAIGRINILLRRNPTDELPSPPKSLASHIRLPDLDKLLERAVEQRPDIGALAELIQAEQIRLALAQKQYYPDAELFGRYDTFWQPRETQSDLREQVGVRINVPIYHRRLNAAVCEARYRVTKANAEYEQLILNVQSDVQSAFEMVRESERTIKLYSAKLIPVAEENVDAARSNYDTGRISFIGLAIAQRQLIEARERLLQTEVEMRRRTASLRRAVGGSLPDGSPLVDTDES